VSAPEPARPPVLILGIGNLLCGDEGVGVHAVERLRRWPPPAHVELLDGGTGGFHLLDCFGGRDHLVIIDATMDGQAAGTVTLLTPRYASDFPRVLTAHDIGLRDLVETASLLAPLPPISLVTISIITVEAMTTALSEPVERAIDEVADLVGCLVVAVATVPAVALAAGGG